MRKLQRIPSICLQKYCNYGKPPNIGIKIWLIIVYGDTLYSLFGYLCNRFEIVNSTFACDGSLINSSMMQDFSKLSAPQGVQFNFDTYVFDLDGTLLSTLDDLAASCNYALRTNGLPERTIDEVRRFVGNGVKKLMERAIPDGLSNPLFEKTYGDFRQHYMSHNLDTTSPYPGIMEMLRSLRARGKRVAVVSNKFYAATQALCRHFFGDLVEVAIGEREDIRKKPAPDTVVEALRQLGVSSDKAVYIGDSDVDVMTARNSGMPCISVLWGFRDYDFLVEHGATIFVTSPLQLA